jgi:hypothetical protein
VLVLVLVVLVVVLVVVVLAGRAVGWRAVQSWLLRRQWLRGRC